LQRKHVFFSLCFHFTQLLETSFSFRLIEKFALPFLLPPPLPHTQINSAAWFYLTDGFPRPFMSCFFNCIPCPWSTGADVSISGKYGNDTKIIGVTRIAVFL
jgi:hypothetical protein